MHLFDTMRKSRSILASTLLFIGSLTLSGCVTGTRYNLTKYDEICYSSSRSKSAYRECLFDQQDKTEQELDDAITAILNKSATKTAESK